MTLNTAPLQTLNAEFADLTLDEALIALRQRFDGRIAFSTSLGLEDQVITDAIFRNGLDIEVFTSQIPGATSAKPMRCWMTRKKYGKSIRLTIRKRIIEHYVTIRHQCDLRIRREP
ncbi:MAG: hypothetical protein R3E93_12075 [Thiothrix sp.]